MNIVLFRQHTNAHYTMGELHINGSRHSYTVESSAIMLPAGDYIVKIVKHSERKQSICIFSEGLGSKVEGVGTSSVGSSLNPNPSSLTLITVGHSWIDCKKENKIAIGTPLMPGAIYKGMKDMERLTDRLTKALQRNETIHLEIKNSLTPNPSPLTQDEAISWWSTHPMHKCPPTRQQVDVDSEGNVTVTYNDGTSRFFPVPEDEVEG